MSWLALLLFSVGLGDLLASTRPRLRLLGTAAAVIATTAAWGLAGLDTLPDAVALGVIAVATCLWTLRDRKSVV